MKGSLRQRQKTSRPWTIFAPTANYLRRSADIIRADVAICADLADLEMDATTPVDSALRIAQRFAGPDFLHVGYIDNGEERFRRLEYGIYSEDFYIVVARLAIDRQGRVRKAHEQMQKKCANGLASVHPKFIEVWEAIMCDIFTSPSLEEILRNLLQLPHAGGGFGNTTAGCIAKPTFPLLGQVGRNQAKSVKKSQAAPHHEQLHAVNVIRGTSGSILLVEPMFPENVVAAWLVYKEKLTSEQRSSVKFPCADTINPIVCATMHSVFPNMQGCALDPTHLAFAVERATREKRTKLSSSLLGIVCKFNDLHYGEASLGDFYQGEHLAASPSESSAARRIARPVQSEKDALKELAAIDTSKGFSSRREFCSMVSSLVASYPILASMTTMYNRYVWEHLQTACSPKTVERYLNNERIRRRVRKDLLEFMAFGTTGSEAVNAELKAWFGRVVHIHAPILRLKLRIFQVSKLMAFCSAKYNETTSQERQSMVMCSVIRDLETFSSEWDSWRDEQRASEAPNKNQHMETRKAHAERLASWKRIMGNTVKKDKAKIKRTPFRNKKRE